MRLLDTIRDAFKGGGPRVPLARGPGATWAFADSFGGPAPYEYTASVRRGYLENPVAHRAVRLLAESMAGAPLGVADPALVALVRATCCGQSLLETVTAQLLLHGNAYVQILKDADGFPVELFALRPERVTLVAGRDGWPTGLSYRVGEQVLSIPMIDGDASPNVIQIRGYHPGDDHYGAGCLNPADMAIAVHNAAAAWNRALLENAARPSGALIYDGGAGLSPEQFARLKEELAGAYSGAVNAGRPLLLEGGLKWQSLSMSPADMDFAALKAAAARDIALAFGVPPMLLGLPGDATYANYREANRALWRLTLLPMAAKLLGALSEGLATWFPEARLEIDQNRVPALAEDRLALWAQVNTASFLSDAEKRDYLGFGPRDLAGEAQALADAGMLTARQADDGL